MKANIGNAERVVRIVVGLILLSLIGFVEGNLKWLGLIGLVPIATALMSYCPLYAVLGINTCSSAGKHQG